MKKVLMSLVILLIVPTLSYAEKSYFLACQEGAMVNVFYKQKSLQFKKGDLFEVPTQALRKQGDRIINDDSRGVCLSDKSETKCPLVVHYGNSEGAYLHGFIDIELGCWFKTEGSIPIKSDTSDKLLNVFVGLVGGTRDEIFGKYLDKEYVDVICSEHPVQFSVIGNTFTDIKKEKYELIAKKAESDRLQKIARDQQLLKDQEERERQVEAKEAARKECEKILEVFYQNYHNKSRPRVPDVIVQKDKNSNYMLLIQHGLMSEGIAFDILNIKKLKDVVNKAGFTTLIFSNMKKYWWWETCEQDNNPEDLLHRRGSKPRNRTEYERIGSEIKARIDYANQLEKSYLERGKDMHVTAEDLRDGSDTQKGLLLHYILMDKSIAYNILKSKGFKEVVRRLGFEEVHFVSVRSNHPERNSYVYYVNEQKLYKAWSKDEGLYIE